MNVLIVSQCDKRALIETRRIIDQFAERKGSRTWQTPITEAGLTTLRTMLKRSARKNTAVACHWIRGQDHTELVWIVGDASRFNAVGTTPTNYTESDVLRSTHESDWHSAEQIKLMAMLAALFHDFGKASQAFQAKLKSTKPVADAYRHEWVSLRLFEFFVAGRSDREWLAHLADPNQIVAVPKQLELEKGGPFAKLHKTSPLAAAIGWMVVSHHRLPTPPAEQFSTNVLGYLPLGIQVNWSFPRVDADAKAKADCAVFPHGIPAASVKWRAKAAQVAQELLKVAPAFASAHTPVLDPYMMSIGRLCLMLADHHYSSLPAEPSRGDADYPLYANTDRVTSMLKQRLDEHLIGVSSHTRRVMLGLMRLEPSLDRIARHRGFKKRTANARFRWQDQAYDLATSLATRSHARGFFGVNMASTGCGKTLANGRIMYGLANPNIGARFTIALGLRTLTLQTGEAYRTKLGLDEADLAIMVGGAAVRELFALGREPDSSNQVVAAHTGSESAANLISDNTYVHFSGATSGTLKHWLDADPRMSQLVHAPVLTCTIDHLMPACESTRGGHQIGPMLRLMSSDLVLDEPDDFDLADVPALSRLVYMAGVLGSRVLLSSATLPPALIAGLFEAYAKGRAWFQKHRRAAETESTIPCGWFDEYGCSTSEQDVGGFEVAHGVFAKKRAEKLATADVRRNIEIATFAAGEDNRKAAADSLAAQIPTLVEKLHAHNHAVQGASGKRVSFGLVRLANIDPLIDVAVALTRLADVPKDLAIHLCVYHSKHSLLMRSAIERMLDVVLQRGAGGDPCSNSFVKSSLERSSAKDHVFMVLASPVAEVGRDHDYDWAIVEPSSMRSLIQLAGRVRRHRPSAYAPINICLLERNLRAAANLKPAYQKPGYETPKHLFEGSSMHKLLRPAELARLDATARIVEQPVLTPGGSFVDIEHQRTRATMVGGVGENGEEESPWTASLSWTPYAHLSGILPQKQRFRLSQKTDRYAFCYDADDEVIRFSQQVEGRRGAVVWQESAGLLKPSELNESDSVRFWGPTAGEDAMLRELLRVGDKTGQDDLDRLSKRFSTVDLPTDDALLGWKYSDFLGFQRQRSGS